MTFTEFLLANGDENLVKYLESVDTLDPIPDAFFNPLYEKLKMYYVTGGMPVSVKMWTEARDVSAMQEVLPDIIGAYERCAATEILVGTDAVANLIREGKCYQIPSILQSGAALGMHSLNADLARLVSTGRITREAAERCATNKSDLKNYL